ncbi:MAG TPA: hypothetical protein DD738_06885 [Ruminiclostridium sp.]|nr:hypothetical protein [Ruminiclostridium sp.]
MDFTGFRKSGKDSRNLFSEVFFVLAACILLNVSVYVLNGLLGFTLPNINFLIHIMLFLSSVISLSIFLISFSSYPQVKNYQILIVSLTFFVVGLLDGFHVLSIPGMIFGFQEWENKTLMIWVITRLLNAAGFSYALAGDEKPMKAVKRRYLILYSILMVILTLCFAAFNPLKIVVFKETSGFTALGVVLAVTIAIFYIYDANRAMKLFNKTGGPIYKMMAGTFVLMFFNVVSMLGIRRFYDAQNLLSQVYQLISYGMMFNVFFVHGIKGPYILLSQTKAELNSYLTEMDKLVDKRTNELRSINEKLMADQEIARGMQMSMLPASLPGNEYVTFSSGYIPAENLSGDFYNVFKIDKDRFGICIGDVSGHGVSAAMLSIFTFQKIQAIMEEADGEDMTIPSIVLKNIYESFNYANFNDDMYIVMLYGVFNTQTGIFSYASGGLNTTPLRIRPDGSIQELENDGFAICKLGELINPKFVNRQILLFPGDKLILYTDGLTDARNSAHEKYTTERLKKTILRHYKWGLDHLTEAILEDVENYTDQKVSDDITMVTVDILPPF